MYCFVSGLGAVRIVTDNSLTVYGEVRYIADCSVIKQSAVRYIANFIVNFQGVL